MILSLLTHNVVIFRGVSRGLIPTDHPDYRRAQGVLQQVNDVFGRQHSVTLALRRRMHGHLFQIPWADDLGIDKYGWWATVALPEVALRMRFVQPGKMRLGSDLNEVGRRIDESPYEVVFTEGFWLAEAELSQQLWQLCMTENPSHFVGSSLPVETVSWVEVQEFISLLNQQLNLPDYRGCATTVPRPSGGVRLSGGTAIAIQFWRKT